MSKILPCYKIDVKTGERILFEPEEMKHCPDPSCGFFTRGKTKTCKICGKRLLLGGATYAEE